MNKGLDRARVSLFVPLLECNHWPAGADNLVPKQRMFLGQAIYVLGPLQLEALVKAEKMSLAVNQCEMVYINPILTATTGVSISEPQRSKNFIPGKN